MSAKQIVKFSMAPLPSYIIAEQSREWPIVDAICELVDNSLGAQASSVRIEYNKRPHRQLIVRDNGVGCKNVQVMLQPGAREMNGKGGVGLFGVGAKQAMMSLANVCNIETVHAGKLSITGARWKDISNLKRYGNEDNQAEIVDCDGPTGTVVTLDELRFKQLDTPALLTKLSWLYMPAIVDGRQILVSDLSGNVRTVAQPEWPNISGDRIKRSLTSGKRRLEVEAGLLTPGDHQGREGLFYYRGFRRMNGMAPEFGIGDLPKWHLFGIVRLLHGWNPSTNKTTVDRQQLDELRQCVESGIADLIAQAKARVDELQNEKMQLKLQAIGQALALVRGRRSGPRGRNPGTIHPTSNGHEHEKFNQEQAGKKPSKKQEQMHGIRMQPLKLGTDGPGWSVSGDTVGLNMDLPCVKRIYNHDPATMGMLAAIALAVHELHYKKQKEFPFSMPDAEYERIPLLAGKYISGVPTET